jgi:hypothetical protein
MKTLSLGLFVFALLIAACNLPSMLTGAGKHTGASTSTSKTTVTEEINGQPVEPDEEETPRQKRKRKEKEVSDGEGFGATCNRNSDCGTKTCFVGKGDLGYCTKMCDSWSDCPSHYECKRAANAPQRICMQDSW